MYVYSKFNLKNVLRIIFKYNVFLVKYIQYLKYHINYIILSDSVCGLYSVLTFSTKYTTKYYHMSHCITQ